MIRSTVSFVEREKRQMFSLCVASCFNCNLLSGGEGISDLCLVFFFSIIFVITLAMPSRPVDVFCICDDDSSGRGASKPQVKKKKKELQVSYKVSTSACNNTVAVSTFAHTVPVGNVNSGKRRSVTQVTTQIAQGK